MWFLGIHQDEKWHHLWRFPTRPDESLYYYENRLKELFLEAGLRPEAIGQVVMSSVVPSVSPLMELLLKQFLGRVPRVLGPALYLDMPFGVLKPYEIGSDPWWPMPSPLIQNTGRTWWSSISEQP